MDSQPPAASSLWDDYDNFDASDDLTHTASSSSTLETVEKQLSSYLGQPRVPRSTNIYRYWYNSQFHLLEPAVRKYLSAPPTSVASEQMFSAAGQIYADRCSNLLGENVDKLLFVTYNIRLFNFDY